ncbi:MAG TPA: hypothetical protein VF996_00010 [Candidatus Saccharimonadales bacterium]
MSEHIPSFSGELKPYSHGYNLYETTGAPKSIVRIRNVDSLIDMLSDHERAWTNALGVSALEHQDAETRVETVGKLIGAYEHELGELENWGITAAKHQYWVDHIKGQDVAVCAADMISGKHIGRAFDRDDDELDFDKLPASVWRSYGQMMSNVVSYYEDVLKKEKFFIFDLADPRQWVYSESDRRIYLVDLDPTMGYHSPKLPSDELDLDVGARLITRVTELVAMDYMPFKDKARTQKIIDGLGNR